MSIRVLIADDHALFRDGVASLVSAWGMDVVGQAVDGHDAIEKAHQLQPELILMDINMPGLGGVEATRAIRAESADVKVVIVTMVDDDESLFEAVRAGANGYILKDTPGDEVGPLLAGIFEGRTPLSAGLAARILDEFAGNRAHERSGQDLDALSERETEILGAVCNGDTNKEIATALGISVNTVNFHMKNILSKLQLRNRAQAVAYAVRTGLVPPSESGTPGS
jgi:DNA-binding NarL/FixJ family response regulator